jgi:hypothetical protein
LKGEEENGIMDEKRKGIFADRDVVFNESADMSF